MTAVFADAWDFRRRRENAR